MAITLTGLASGLDTETIVAQLMAIEQNKVTAVQRRQTSVTQHKLELNGIKSKLDAVKSAAADLTSAATWKPVQTTSSSDPTKVDVTLLGGAGIGGHTLQVNKLASSAQHGYAFTPNAAAGKITLFFGTDPNAAGNSKLTLDVAANATATDLATAVNANEGSPVYAAVIKDGADERLVFSARKSGASSDFTVDTSQLAGGQLTEVPTYARTGTALNAEYIVDGEVDAAHVGVQRHRERDPGCPADAQGRHLEPRVGLHDAGGDRQRGDHEEDHRARGRLQRASSPRRAPSSPRSGSRRPRRTTDLQKGQLFGDSGMSSMLNALKQALVQPLKYNDPVKVGTPSTSHSRAWPTSASAPRRPAAAAAARTPRPASWSSTPRS